MTDKPTADDRSLVARVADGVKSCLRRDGESREWQALDRAERGRIAHDVGMGSAELGSLIAGSDGAAELDEVLRRTGLQPEAAMRGMLPDMQRVCGLCRDRGECRDWLSVPAEARDDAALPYFCPNRDEVEMLRDLRNGGR